MTAITSLAAARLAYYARPSAYKPPAKVSASMWSQDNRDDTQHAIQQIEDVLDRAIAEIAAIAERLDDGGAAFDPVGFAMSLNDAFLDASDAYDKAMEAFDDERAKRDVAAEYR